MSIYSPSMAVGKRLRSRDEHLMLIIPMLGVTNLRGDVRCPTVKQYWTYVLGLARRPNRGSPQRVGHLGQVQNRSPPSHHARIRGCIVMCRGGSLTVDHQRFTRCVPWRWIRAFIGFDEVCADVTRRDKPLRLSLPRVKATLTAFECLLVGFELRGHFLTVGSSRHLVFAMVASGPDLIQISGFSPNLQTSFMADVVQRKIPVEDNMDCVADDPRTTLSKFEFEENFPEDLFTEIEDPGHANWEVRIPGAKQRICSSFKNGGFPVYQIIFEHMGLRLPFSDLEIAVFNHMELCPSQLHPNSLAFIRAFEIVAAYLQPAPTVPLFFHIFGIQHSRPRGNVKCGWVSLKQHKKYFEIFEESLRGFKDKWFVVRPITYVGWKTIIVRGPKLDDEGRVEHRDDGEPIEVDCERFPFCWSTKHYAREAKSFTSRKGALSKEELADLKALEEFVEEFPPSLWEDREGNPICDEEGYQLSSKFINTKTLLKCSTRTEAEDLLREMKSTQQTLRKLQAEKKKRQLGASSSTPNASGQSYPTPSIEVTGERRIAEEVTGGQRPPKHARVEGGGGVVSGPHRLVPGKAAAEFVIPPAMGHDCVVDGRTSMRISDADQSILASMGPESIRNVVSESSVAVFKLLEVATFLNGRECKYLRERDEARENAKDFGERLSVVEKDLCSETRALKESQAKVTQLEKDLRDAREEEERLKGKVGELEEQVSRLSLGPAVEEEEKKLDPEGAYATSSRADLIVKIYQISDLQLDVASSSFKNALAQLQVLNPGVQLVTEGMDEMKEVRDGQIASPPLDEEN
ncbi:hypothetical protein TSUD_411190 [Trifolium subterraneum]|uniref:Transposase (putative) gypsy type domain-containing protein n=1 Tax=Trifolium subterraneum TaxID=3900 RepID=A0A2Z6PJR5_TRISU|nr:hypothetical protein TSUD_411190 [Trifolium subterraneum]